MRLANFADTTSACASFVGNANRADQHGESTLWTMT